MGSSGINASTFFFFFFFFFGSGSDARSQTPRLRGRSAERGASVQIPVSPCAAGETVLKEHADDGHHSQPTICKLGVELRLASVLVLHGAAGVRDTHDASIGIVAPC